MRFLQAMDNCQRVYRRNLPHWFPEGAAVFVTWCLFATIPPRIGLDRLKDGRAFAALDRTLDRALSGPAWLREPAVADLVAGVIEASDGDRGLCRLHCFVVMPNHVHLLITPRRPLHEVTKWIKGGLGSQGESGVGQGRWTVLAGRVLRSLGPVTV